MTIATRTSKAAFSGNGVTTDFPLPFPFRRDADIKAVLREGGAETPLQPGSHFVLVGAGSSEGGQLTMAAAPAQGQTLVVWRAPDIVQEVDYVENAAFPAETHEGALDLLTMVCQSLQEQMDRAVLYPVSTPDGEVLDSPAFLGSAAASRDAAQQSARESAASAEQAGQSAAQSAASAGQAAQSAAQAESVAATLDGAVKVSASDAVARSLSAKLAVADGLAESVLAPGGDETLRLSVALAATPGLEFTSGLLRVKAGAGLVLSASGLAADAGTGAGQLVRLDAAGRLPALDARNLTRVADQLPRDLAAMNALVSWLAAGRASGPVPGGYLWTFLSDEWNRSGASYNAESDCYAASVAIGANFLPTFTTYTMSGYTLSANQEVSGYPAYYAAGTGSGTWLTSTPSGTNWLKIVFPSAQHIQSYDIKAGTAWAPKDWQLEGSNTGAFAGEQVVLDARSAITAWASSVQTLAFECANPGTYSHVRLVITANNGHGSHGGGMNGLLLRGAGAVSNMTIVSPPVSLGFIPAKATAYVLHRAVDAVALNTDITVGASRGGGWAYATDLVDLGAYSASYKLLRASASLSALSSGQSGYARIETANHKRQHIRAVLAWFE